MPRWRAESCRTALAVTLGAAMLGAVAPVAPAHAQTPSRPSANALLLPTRIRVTAAPAPGREADYFLGDVLREEGWRQDALGNYVLRRGSGSPRRVVACALDQPTFVVGEITDDGFLRLHDPADPRRHPLWAQFHEGERVAVGTAPKEVAGVTAVRSTHLWRRRPAQDSPASTDDLWVDVGARSRAEVEKLGVHLLDPVRRDFELLEFGVDEISSGPNIQARVSCAAVAGAAGWSSPRSGETIFVLAAQSAFNHTGLSAVLSGLDRVDSLVLVDSRIAQGSDTSAAGGGPVTVRAVPTAPFLAHDGSRTAVVAVGVRSAFPGTLVEGVTRRDAQALVDRVASLAGAQRAVPMGGASKMATAPERPTDRPSEIAALLARLADSYGVAGHEARVRDAVRAELPQSLRARATVDTAGNLILVLGPDRDTTVFVAHLDEIGYEVKAIARDGTVSLTPRGGFFGSLWEGQPALLHLDAAVAPAGCALPRYDAADRLRGVFVPRSTASKKQPDAQTAWFGTDSAGLVACGVRVGMAVTGVKQAQRLAGTRFTARSIDDRVGCTALLLALRAIDPAKLTHKVIFVWSVREETGLEGASALAASLGPSVHRVHAVDTFVSSDSPLESHRFAYAPIGKGAVVRALDNSSATPRAEVERVVEIARRAGIPLQIGTTNGGNDGAELARYGAVDVPLSWPARYSHSPVETIDLKDVDALARLIAALVNARD